MSEFEAQMRDFKMGEPNPQCFENNEVNFKRSEFKSEIFDLTTEVKF